MTPERLELTARGAPVHGGRHRPRDAAPRPLQRRERARRRRRCPAPRICRTRRSREASPASAACPAASSRWTRDSRSSSSSTTRTRPDSLRDCAAHGARPGRRPRHLRLRLRRRPRPRQAAADGPGCLGGQRPRHRHLRQPAERGSRRDHRARCSRASTGEMEVEPDRPRAIAQAVEAARARRRRPDRRQGARAGPGAGGQDGAVRRPRGRPRRVAPARGARVIALTLDEVGRALPRSARSRSRRGTRSPASRSTPGSSSPATSSSPSTTRAPTSAPTRSTRGAAAALIPEDAFAALAALGGAVRDRSNARVVGITGSAGKTSTKDILAAICRPRTRTVAAEASFNNEIGVPLTLCRLEPDTEVCILELAMRGLGQIAELCAVRAARDRRDHQRSAPAHVEQLGSIEAIARAKSELVDALPPGGTAIVPEDLPVRARRPRS